MANVGSKDCLYPAHWYTLFNPDLAMRNRAKKFSSISAVVVHPAIGDKSVVVRWIKNKICQFEGCIFLIRCPEPWRAKKVVAAKDIINKFLALVSKIEKTDATHESTKAVPGTRIEIKPLILVVEDFSRLQNGFVCGLGSQMKNMSFEMGEESISISVLAWHANYFHRR